MITSIIAMLSPIGCEFATLRSPGASTAYCVPTEAAPWRSMPTCIVGPSFFIVQPVVDSALPAASDCVRDERRSARPNGRAPIRCVHRSHASGRALSESGRAFRFFGNGPATRASAACRLADRRFQVMT
ncbi:hypothetical protein X946_3422 [Burkholderia sp. ABCPW 111]|nr:hypothetical protein X946_3422 [Burkholderia sp. ABCPW 111]